MTFALGLALIAPALGLAGAFAVRSELLGRRCLQGGALVAAAAWAALVGDGSGASVGAFHAGPLAAAAGCGAALSLVAVDRPARLPRLVAGGMTLLAAGLAVTNGHAELQGPALALAVAVAAVGGAAGQPRRRVPLAYGLAAAAATTTLVGVALVRTATASWDLPQAPVAGLSLWAAGLALLAAAAALIAAGALQPRSPAGAVVAVGAFVGLRAAPLARSGPGGLRAAAVVLAVAAAAAAFRPRRRPRAAAQPALALGLLGLAAAMAPGATTPAAALLEAAAVLAVAVGTPASAALGLPGGVALALALAASGGGVAFAVGTLTALTALALSAGARSTPVTRPAVSVVPALAAGGWLLLAPGSWAWTGPARLGPYDMGAARAAAAALVVVLALAHMSLPDQSLVTSRPSRG